VRIYQQGAQRQRKSKMRAMHASSGSGSGNGKNCFFECLAPAVPLPLRPP
jgi:hypothetical protein